MNQMNNNANNDYNRNRLNNEKNAPSAFFDYLEKQKERQKHFFKGYND